MKYVAVFNVCEPSHVFENCLRQLSCLAPVHAGCEHHKLVATETRNDSFVIHGSFQLVGNLANQAIARRMSAGVVDVLELVEIDEEQGTARLGDRDVVDFLFQFVDETTTIE